MCPLERENAVAINQYFQLTVGKSHLRLNAVFRFQFALQAPGQASFIGSNQAAVDFDSSFLVHSYFASVMPTLAVVVAQSSFSVAAFPPVLSSEMVNCSVDVALVATFMSTRARSCFSS